MVAPDEMPQNADSIFRAYIFRWFCHYTAQSNTVHRNLNFNCVYNYESRN